MRFGYLSILIVWIIASCAPALAAEPVSVPEVPAPEIVFDTPPAPELPVVADLPSEPPRGPLELAQAPPVAAPLEMKADLQDVQPAALVKTQEAPQPLVGRIWRESEPPKAMVVYKVAQQDMVLPPILKNPYNPNVVPEPGSIVVLAGGMGAFMIGLRRRRK